MALDTSVTVVLGFGVSVLSEGHGELLLRREHEPVAAGGGEVGERDQVDDRDPVRVL